jgi:tetratricopeptide (TPR) repeat protein
MMMIGSWICSSLTPWPPSAVEHFTQAIMLRPEKAEYFYNRGNCYNKLGETQKALLDYSMAIRIDNKTATYYEHR